MYIILMQISWPGPFLVVALVFITVCSVILNYVNKQSILPFDSTNSKENGRLRRNWLL